MTINDLTKTFDGAYNMSDCDYSILSIQPNRCNICITDGDEVIYRVEMSEVRHVSDAYNYYEGLIINNDDIKFASVKWRDLCKLEIDSFNINLNAEKFNFYIDISNFSNLMSSDKFFRFDELLIKLYNN